MSFWYLQFSQKTNKKIWPYCYGTSSQIVFVCFLGELKKPKGHFEINWPLWIDRMTYGLPDWFFEIANFWPVTKNDWICAATVAVWI